MIRITRVTHVALRLDTLNADEYILTKSSPGNFRGGPLMEHDAAAGAAPNRKVQMIELGVFLFLILPTMGASFLIGRQANIDFVITAVVSILNDLGLIGLIFYLIWRNGESMHVIGWRFENPGHEVGWGLLLFVPVYFGTQLLETAVQRVGLGTPSAPPSFLVASGGWQIMLAFILVVVVAVAEETIFRGYLILRFTSVFGRAGPAVLLSAIVFVVGHGYEGLPALIGVFFLGLTFAVVYLWRGSLIAPMLMHFLTDFISLVLPAISRTVG
jgi:membrane protease YdiL (CAAX protease family)